MSGSKKQTVKIRDQTVDLIETKNLYGRLMVLTKSNRDVDQWKASGSFELYPDSNITFCTRCINAAMH